MPQIAASSRIATHRRELGRLVPRAFTRTCWYRFARDRRAGFLRRLGRDPTEREAMLIEQLINSEWHALRLEREAETAAPDVLLEFLRLAADRRRQLILLDRELVRAAPPPPAKVTDPIDPLEPLRRHLARRHEATP